MKKTNAAGTIITPPEPKVAAPAREGGKRKGPAKPSEEEVRHLAYQKWEDAGRPEGADVWFWLEAEQELFRAHARRP